jgi:hypothetical protein
VSGELDFKGWRCLNCGDIVDPVIVRHHLSARSVPVGPRRRWRGPIRARADEGGSRPEQIEAA